MTESWLIEVLTGEETPTGTRLHASSGRLDWSQFRAVQGAGTVQVTAAPGDLDLLSGRLRIRHVSGDRVTPMGVWLLSASRWVRDATRATTELSLLDKTELLNSPVGAWLSIPAGTAPTVWVSDMLAAQGIRETSVTGSTATLAAALHWDPDATWLTVANDVLAAINYGPVRADMEGRLTVAPYVEPHRRPLAAVYGGEPGDHRMRPSWSDDAQTWSLPTGFRIVVEGTDDRPGLIGAADLPEEHPLSAAARGRVLLRTDTAEAADQSVADQIAERRLWEALQVTRRAQVTHPVDGTVVGDLVEHRPIGLKGAIVEREVELGLGAVVTDVIRHIYTGGELPW